METINRLERGTRANFNLQFPNARRESEDPAIAAVREEWQAAIGDGPHWSTKMIAYHIAGALDEDLALVLSGDAIYPDGIVRRRLSPEDAERVLSAVQVEVRRRQRLGLAGSRAIAALAALDDDEDGSVEKKKEQRREPLEGEYEERHLEETVKQCIEDVNLMHHEAAGMLQASNPMHQRLLNNRLALRNTYQIAPSSVDVKMSSRGVKLPRHPYFIQ